MTVSPTVSHFFDEPTNTLSYLVTAPSSRRDVHLSAGVSCQEFVTGRETRDQTLSIPSLILLSLTPILYHLPTATLAATIIVAVLSLIDLGNVPGAERFRNVQCHRVITHPGIVTMRIDESLYFVNASYMESAIYALVAERDTQLKHSVLQCTAVNTATDPDRR